MIRQERIRNAKGPATRVTFLLPASTWAETVHLVGDFNGWSTSSHPFHRDREGQWSIAVDLDNRRSYRFRYLLDGRDWLTDGQAEGWPAIGGATDFVVRPLVPAPGGQAPERAPAGRPLPVPARRVAAPA